MTEPTDRAPRDFDRDGFALVKLLESEQAKRVEDFAGEWIQRLLEPWVKHPRECLALGHYHSWYGSLGVDHGAVFVAKNRHTSPGRAIRSLLVNDRLRGFLSDLGVGDYDLWDEGLGWLAFRFVRPGFGDGYPMSRKSWGPAKTAISIWLPVIGHEPEQTLTMVPGSHRREYEKFIPRDTKFRADEFRLRTPVPDAELFSPRLQRGQAIVYHPRLLHSEDVERGDMTRLSLEFRVEPKN